MDKISIIKIGGKVIEESIQFESFLKIFAGAQNKKILIHGGGKRIDQVSNKLGLKVNMIEGRRITDENTIEVVQMVLAGLLNKNIVCRLQGMECNAIGLTGADGNLIRAKKRPVKNGIDYGWVGDVENVNSGFLSDLLKKDLVPVIASMTHNGKGKMLNTNADTVAAEIAIALTNQYSVELIYCFDQEGVLKDINDINSLIPVIRYSEYDRLKSSGWIADGMIPKINNAFSAINRGVKEVYIMNALNIESYFSGQQVRGTIITR